MNQKVAAQATFDKISVVRFRVFLSHHYHLLRLHHMGHSDDFYVDRNQRERPKTCDPAMAKADTALRA